MTLRVPRWLLSILAFLVLATGLSIGGYFLGEASVDEAELRAEGFEEGQAEGEDVGYDEGYDSGVDAGKEQARQNIDLFAEFNEGYRTGRKDGGSEALALESFDWNTGTWYLVQFQDGSGSIPLEIETYVDFQAGRNYSICDANEICYR